METCPDCGGRTKRHCNDSRTCDWWACIRCCSYGNTQRYVSDPRKRGAS